MLIGIIIIVSLILLDQLTKFIVVSNFALGESRTIIDGFFSLTYRLNDGAAFSILRGKMWLFYVITVVALVIFYTYFKGVDFKNRKVYSIGISMLIAGTIGNFIDRLRLQEVIDFLDFIIFGYDFAIFNVADICLNVGIALFIVAVIFLEKEA